MKPCTLQIAAGLAHIWPRRACCKGPQQQHRQQLQQHQQLSSHGRQSAIDSDISREPLPALQMLAEACKSFTDEKTSDTIWRSPPCSPRPPQFALQHGHWSPLASWLIGLSLPHAFWTPRNKHHGHLYQIHARDAVSSSSVRPPRAPPRLDHQ